MKRQIGYVAYSLIAIAIYPLLIFLIVATVLGAHLFDKYSPDLSELAFAPTPTRVILRLAALPPASPAVVPAPGQALPDDQPGYNPAQPAVSVNSQTEAATQTVAANSGTEPPRVQENPPQANSSAQPVAVDSASGPGQSGQTSPAGEVAALPTPTPSPTIDLDFSVFSGTPSPTPVRRRSVPTATPRGFLSSLVDGIVGAISEATPAPTRVARALIPTFTPTPTSTATPPPTNTPTATPVPTDTPSPTATPTVTPTPLPTNTPPPTYTPTATPIPPPTETTVPTATPLPEYDFLLNEFFNSPTTNHFLVMYVAVVDGSEIPIGDVKVVGTRLDHNLTYESPLTTWHYEGYNAPGEVIKSGNTKFEPPGGIEDTSWVLHLEDAHGNRMSADIPFDTSASDKQWYFVKFRRKL